jgi:hypothetical protein
MAMPVVEVAQGEVMQIVMGEAIPGAVESGPASMFGISVISRTNAPDDYKVTGSRYSVMQKTLAPGEEFQSDPGVSGHPATRTPYRGGPVGLRPSSLLPYATLTTQRPPTSLGRWPFAGDDVHVR